MDDDKQTMSDSRSKLGNGGRTRLRKGPNSITEGDWDKKGSGDWDSGREKEQGKVSGRKGE